MEDRDLRSITDYEIAVRKLVPGVDPDDCTDHFRPAELPSNDCISRRGCLRARVCSHAGNLEGK